MDAAPKIRAPFNLGLTVLSHLPSGQFFSSVLCILMTSEMFEILLSNPPSSTLIGIFPESDWQLMLCAIAVDTEQFLFYAFADPVLTGQPWMLPLHSRCISPCFPG